jgi:hypothetical protein
MMIEDPYKSGHFEFLHQKVRIKGLKHLCETLSLYNSKCCVLNVVDSGVFSKMCDSSFSHPVKDSRNAVLAANLFFRKKNLTVSSPIVAAAVSSP